MSKIQIPTTAENRKIMEVIPYASVIGSYCILCPGLAREYNSDLGVDHWTLVKIILSEIRKYFSIMEVTKGSS